MKLMRMQALMMMFEPFSQFNRKIHECRKKEHLISIVYTYNFTVTHSGCPKRQE